MGTSALRAGLGVLTVGLVAVLGSSSARANIIITAGAAAISNTSQTLGTGGAYVFTSSPSSIITNPYVALSGTTGTATQPVAVGAVNQTTGSTGNASTVTVTVTNTSPTTAFLVQAAAVSDLDWSAAVQAPAGSGSLQGAAQTELVSAALGLNRVNTLPMNFAVTNDSLGLGPTAGDFFVFDFVVPANSAIVLSLTARTQGEAVATSGAQGVSSSFDLNSSIALNFIGVSAVVPEPISLTVWAVGAAGVVAAARCRRRPRGSAPLAV